MPAHFDAVFFLQSQIAQQETTRREDTDEENVSTRSRLQCHERTSEKLEVCPPKNAQTFRNILNKFYCRIKMHEERKTKQKTDDVPEGAVPAYLLDRESQNRAKVLSNMIKQKRKEKAVGGRKLLFSQHVFEQPTAELGFWVESVQHCLSI